MGRMWAEWDNFCVWNCTVFQSVYQYKNIKDAGLKKKCKRQEKVSQCLKRVDHPGCRSPGSMGSVLAPFYKYLSGLLPNVRLDHIPEPVSIGCVETAGIFRIDILCFTDYNSFTEVVKRSD